MLITISLAIRVVVREICGTMTASRAEEIDIHVQEMIDIVASHASKHYTGSMKNEHVVQRLAVTVFTLVIPISNVTTETTTKMMAETKTADMKLDSVEYQGHQNQLQNAQRYEETVGRSTMLEMMQMSATEMDAQAPVQLK